MSNPQGPAGKLSIFVNPEWFDVSRIYDSGVMVPLLQQQIPAGIEAELKIWLDQVTKLSFEQYRKVIRGQFRALAGADPRAPVDLIVQWASSTLAGLPASSMLGCWLGELLSLTHSNEVPKALFERVANALKNPPQIWTGACTIGDELWSGKSAKQSAKQIEERLSLWLADHVAAHLWGARWLMKTIWPQTARTEPYAYEQRSQDIMDSRNTMKSADAIQKGQLERIFGEAARKDPDYNPEHPQAHAVKIESPKMPPPGQKAFLLLFTILPLVLHHKWTAADILRSMMILQPPWAKPFDLKDPAKRDVDCRYVVRGLLKPAGLWSIVPAPGRPQGSGDQQPPAWGLAYNAALLLRGQVPS
jgi:hypothetical protein